MQGNTGKSREGKLPSDYETVVFLRLTLNKAMRWYLEENDTNRLDEMAMCQEAKSRIEDEMTDVDALKILKMLSGE